MIFFFCCHWSHHLIVYYNYTFCHSHNLSVFRTSQLVKFKGDAVGTNLCKPSAIQYCFWFTVFVDRVSANGLYLAFSTLITLTHGSGNHDGVSANSWVMLFSLCIQKLGNNHKVNSGTPVGSLYSGPEPKLHWSSRRNTVIFWVSWNWCRFRANVAGIKGLLLLAKRVW